MFLDDIHMLSLPADFHQNISKIQEMPISDIGTELEIDQNAHLNII